MDVPPIEHQVRRGNTAAESMEWGTVRWLARKGDPPGAEMMTGVAAFAAGKGNAEHVHPDCEEIVYVLEGAVMHTLGDEATTLHASDIIIVPRGVPHRLAAMDGADARALIVFSSPDRQFVPTGR